MSELQFIVQERIRRSLSEIKEGLHTRLGTKRTEFAARNVFHSSMHVQAIVGECSNLYKEAVPIVCKELEWWLQESLYVSEKKSLEIADFGVRQMSDCLDVELTGLVERSRKLISNDGMFESIVRSHVGRRIDAGNEIRLFVRKWRAENQRNILRSIGPIIRKLFGF